MHEKDVRRASQQAARTLTSDDLFEMRAVWSKAIPLPLDANFMALRHEAMKDSK